MKVQPDLRRGRFPDKKNARLIAEAVHAVARELEI
jgi:CspA family cold shock protein